MAFTKEEKRLLRHLVGREAKHLQKDTKRVLLEESIQAIAGEAKAKLFMRNLLKKLR